MTRVLCSHSRLLWSCPCLAHTRCSFVSHLWKTFLLKSFPPNHAVLCVSCIYIACFVQNLTKWTCAGRSRASKSWSKRSGSTLATKWQTGGWLTKSLRSICFKNFTFWIARCGQGLGSTDTNERSPIFLQWLDCVHQVNTVLNCHPMINVTTSPIFSTNVYCVAAAFAISMPLRVQPHIPGQAGWAYVQVTLKSTSSNHINT